MFGKRLKQETTTFPKTRQGVRDLDRAGNVLPYSGGQAEEPGNVSGTERWLSIAAGGALMGLGLMRRSMPGLNMALMGVGLLARGVSGRCLVYRALGISTAESQAKSEKVYRYR